MEVPWVIDEQTSIKHVLLNSYIRPWMAIFFSTQAKYNLTETLFYFDGFAGPGTYYTNETKTDTCDGSPVIVARAANDYIQANPRRRVVIFCIDRDKQCVDLLEQKLGGLNIHKQLWRVFHAEFDRTINEILDQVDSQKLCGYPMFFFIDPLGYSGYPLHTVKRILHYPRAEVFINFMVYDIVRFAFEEQFRPKLTALFGSTDFLCYKDAPTAEQRQAFLLNTYCEALRTNAGASYVMPFRLNAPGLSNRPRYYLLHASNKLKALKVMKDAMWKHSESELRFEAIGIYKSTYPFRRSRPSQPSRENRSSLSPKTIA